MFIAIVKWQVFKYAKFKFIPSASLKEHTGAACTKGKPIGGRVQHRKNL